MQRPQAKHTLKQSHKDRLLKGFFQEITKVNLNTQTAFQKNKKNKWEGLKIHSELGGDLRHKVRDITVMKLVEGGGRTGTGRDQLEAREGDDNTQPQHESQDKANRLRSDSEDWLTDTHIFLFSNHLIVIRWVRHHPTAALQSTAVGSHDYHSKISN